MTAACAVFLLVTLPAQERGTPSARLIRTSRLDMPGAVDSNVPMTWALVEGRLQLFATTSWGGIPALLGGDALDRMERILDAVTIAPHPGDGVWIEAIVPDAGGAWYGYYHHEQPASRCDRADRQIPRIGAARSTDGGRTWDDLGIVLEASPSSDACRSTNRFVLGGVGDVSALLDPESRDLYLFFSQYVRDPAAQGVAVARLAWADRDQPAGKIMIWQDGVWLPASRPDDESRWEYPIGTPLVAARRAWHDGNQDVEAFWGPSIHWNTYLERYVMLLNQSRNESFDNEGIYIAYAATLDDPGAWTAPRKLMSGGGWYPQVAGLEAGIGTDKVAGQRARFFLTGRSEQMIEFER
jgi:hypothetical protein